MCSAWLPRLTLNSPAASAPWVAPLQEWPHHMQLQFVLLTWFNRTKTIYSLLVYLDDKTWERFLWNKLFMSSSYQGWGLLLPWTRGGRSKGGRTWGLSSDRRPLKNWRGWGGMTKDCTRVKDDLSAVWISASKWLFLWHFIVPSRWEKTGGGLGISLSFGAQQILSLWVCDLVSTPIT